MKARLARYALWQARDALFERGLPILLIGALIVFASHESLTDGARATIAAGGAPARFFGAIVMKSVLDATWFVFALIAVHGVSANDRTTGRFRLLFAKPVGVVRYYAQAWLISGALLMACVALVVAATDWVVPMTAQTARGALAVYFAGWVLVGGLCFLCSALWRFDWVATVGVVGVTDYLAGRHLHALWLRALPPVWKLSQQAQLVKDMEPLEWKPLVWAAVYGVACFLLGLLVLRRRPLAT